MNQYIDFFKTYRSLIEEGCSPLINAERNEAYERFCRQGFPAYGSEDYQHIDIDKLLSSDFGFYLKATPASSFDPYERFHCSMPNLGSHLHYVVNGFFYPSSKTGVLPEGVFSGSLNEFANRYPDLFKQYYNRQAQTKGDSLAAFNTAFVQDGYVLYLPKNRVIDNPIQLTNLINGTANSLINRRLLIILEPGAQAKLMVCDHTTDEQPTFATTQVTEVYVGENAVFDLYELEESTPKTIRLTATFVQQEASSNVMVNNLTLSNGVTRNNYRMDIDGEGAQAHLFGMAIADNRETIDNHTLIRHNVPHCESNELFKYVLDGEALGSFSGRIVVTEGAQKTQAYQTNRNLCGNKTCRMYSKPQLEIYADDVKCSHGMTTGQLDETALFYMRSRGIPEQEARLLLKFAFTNDVIEGIRLESMRERLKHLVEKRFRGELVKCQGCI